MPAEVYTGSPNVWPMASTAIRYTGRDLAKASCKRKEHTNNADALRPNSSSIWLVLSIQWSVSSSL